MADVRKTVELVLKVVGANTKQISKLTNDFEKLNASVKKTATSLKSSLTAASKPVQKLAQDVKTLGNTAQESGLKVRTFGDKVRTVFEFRLISMALIQIKESILAAAASIIDYSQALKDLEAITGATSSEISQMGITILDVASKTKFSASEVAEGMRVIGQAGFSAGEAVESMQAISDLATGTLSTMASTVDLVTTTLRIFNIEATESAMVADVFANAVNRSKLTIDKLRTSMNYIGPIAQASNISFKELSASMMVLANSGLRASKIGTGLRRVFAELIDPSKKLKEAARAAGIALGELDPRSVSLSTVIANLGLVVNDAQVAFDIFGKRGAAAVLALSGSTGNFNEMLQVVQKSGTAAEMAATQMEGLGVSFKNLKDKLGILAIAIGKAGIADAMKIFVDITRVLVDALTVLIDSTFVRFIAKATLVTGAILGIGLALKALAVPAFVGILSGLAKLATAAFLAEGSILALAGAGIVANPIFAALAATIGSIALIMYSMEDGSKKAANAAAKLASEYKNLNKYMSDHKEKTASMVEGSTELKEANLVLRKKLFEVAEAHDELSIYALKALRSINPLTGAIDEESVALETLSKRIKDLEFKKLVEESEAANKSFTKQTSYANANAISLRTSLKLLKTLVTDPAAFVQFQALNREAIKLSEGLADGSKSFKDLHKWANSVDLTNLIGHQKVLYKLYVDSQSSSSILYETMVKTGKISLDYPIKQIERIASEAGISGEALQSLIVYVNELKKSITFDSTVTKWAQESQDGKLDALTKYIEDYKELKLAITETQEAEIRQADKDKQRLVDRRKQIEEEKNLQLQLHGESKELWIKYYDDLDALDKEAAEVSTIIAENTAAQKMIALIRLKDAYEKSTAEINAMDESLMREKIKRQRKLDTEYEKSREKIEKDIVDPKELLASSKEKVKIIENEYKAKQLITELASKKRGESEATLAKKIQKLEEDLSAKVVAIWKEANEKMIAQKDTGTDAAKAINIKMLQSQTDLAQKIADIEISKQEEKLKILNDAYDKANSEREVAHANSMNEMIKKELEAGTSVERIEKNKAGMALKLREDIFLAAELHFKKIKELYEQDTDEYQDSQDQLAEARIAFLEESLKYTKTYAKLEYDVEKAKIQAIIALNKGTLTSDINTQKAHVEAAKKILKASYDDGIVTLKGNFAEKRKIEEDNYNKNMSALSKFKTEQTEAYKKLDELETGDKASIKAKADLKQVLLNVNTKIQVLNKEYLGTLADLKVAENDAIATNEKKIASMIRQFETLKSNSDISTASDDSRDLDEKHAAQIKRLKDENTERIRLLEEQTDITGTEDDKIRKAKEINQALIDNLIKKQARERHEQALTYQDLELDTLKSKLDVQHELKLKAIEEELAAGKITEQDADKERLQAKVAYYNRVRIEAQNHYDKLTKFDTVEDHQKRLNDKLEADKEYYAALTDEVVGLSDIQKELRDAEFDADEEKTESQFDLDMTKQTEAVKTALQENKSQFDQDLINSKEYFDNKREIAEDDLDFQLDRLAIEKEIFIARMKLRIADEKDEKKKLDLKTELFTTIKELEESEIKVKQNYNRAMDKIDADEFKNTEKNQKKIESMIDSAKKLRDSLLQKDEGTSLADKQKSELAIFDDTTKSLVDGMIEREASLAQAEELSIARKEARDLLVAQHEKAMHDLRLTQVQNFSSDMAALTASMYNSGIIHGEKAFRVMQGMAIAEAMVNTYKSATDAYAEAGNPVLGAVMAAIAIAQGLVNVAIIRKQKPEGYSAGGEIQGYSPSSTADNIDIKATAGEYMHPVKAVQKYGLRAMNAIRTLSIPKEALQNLISGTMGSLNMPTPSFALAAGGSVPASAMKESNKGSLSVSMTNNFTGVDESVARRIGNDFEERVQNVLHRIMK